MKYALNYNFNNDIICVLDLDNNEELDLIAVRSLLNEQDEKIKKQRKIIQNNNQKTVDMYFERLRELDEKYNIDLNERLKEIEELKQENQQLKQSQSKKAIEVLKKYKEFIHDYFLMYKYIPKDKLLKKLEAQIIELKEKK